MAPKGMKRSCDLEFDYDADVEHQTSKIPRKSFSPDVPEWDDGTIDLFLPKLSFIEDEIIADIDDRCSLDERPTTPELFYYDPQLERATEYLREETKYFGFDTLVVNFSDEDVNQVIGTNEHKHFYDLTSEELVDVLEAIDMLTKEPSHENQTMDA